MRADNRGLNAVASETQQQQLDVVFCGKRGGLASFREAMRARLLSSSNQRYRRT